MRTGTVGWRGRPSTVFVVSSGMAHPAIGATLRHQSSRPDRNGSTDALDHREAIDG